MENIDAAKTKFDSLTQIKSELVSEGRKVQMGNLIPLMLVKVVL